jgi:hypothetical protein
MHCRRVANLGHINHITTILLANLRRGLGKSRGVRTTTYTRTAPSHRLPNCGLVATQANGELAEHVRDKLLAHEGAVAVLGRPGSSVGEQVNEGLAKAVFIVRGTKR